MSPLSDRATSVLLLPAEDAYQFRNGGSKAEARLRAHWRRKARQQCRKDGTTRCVLRSPDGHNLEIVEID